MSNHIKPIIFLVLGAVALVLLAALLTWKIKKPAEVTSPAAISSSDSIGHNIQPVNNSDTGSSDQISQPVKSAEGFYEPISNALSRVTKKPFGIYITPATSPVQPESFQGYHTGTDFEITPDELNKDVPVMALCDGTLAVKRMASGYGGVMVESCLLNNQPITVIYGHVKISSSPFSVGDKLKGGEQIAVLGANKSAETDGERKHLHLGVHKGSAVNILGYVSNQSELSGWIDVAQLLK